MPKIRNKKQAELARIRREYFKERLIFELNNESFSRQITNEELAALTRESLSTVKRYLKHLQQAGVIESQSFRWYHPEYGWSNRRVLNLTPDYCIVAMNRRNG
jgi:response regulator of citrate/malate metabolism